MLKNYLRSTVRNILKYKGYSFINITGLAVGMACAILIFLWVQDELSFDRFHKNSNELYRIVLDSMEASASHDAVTPGVLAGLMKKELPEVTHSTRLLPLSWRFKYGEESFQERGGLADPDFFSMFTFPFVRGNPETALVEPLSIVITERIAKKYFPNENPIGKKMVTINNIGFLVTGVIKDIPYNSHFHFDYLLPFELMKKFGTNIDSWTNISYFTYVLLGKGSSVDEVNQKLKQVVAQNDPKKNIYYLQPLTRIHLFSNFNFDFADTGDIKYVIIFSLVAVLVLLIACINFVNLATARSAVRTREIGMRKVVGASRLQLITQFLGESMILTFLGCILALFLTSMILPSFNNLTGKSLTINILNLKSILAFIALVLFTGIVSGSYPAFFLSSHKPVTALKGLVNQTRSRRSSLLRNLLVVVQFSLSGILIIGTITIYKQLGFIKRHELGFEKKNLVNMSINSGVSNKYDSLRNELLRNPDVLGVTVSDYLPTFIGTGTSNVDWEGKATDAAIQMQILSVNDDYMAVYKIKMLDGRFFSKEFTSDSDNHILLNEAALDAMGIQDPIGKRVTFIKTNYTVIGIIKNFHYKSIRKKIEPLIIRKFKTGQAGYLSVRIKSDNIPATITFLEKIWKKFAPQYPFEYTFLDDRIDRMYRAEKRMSEIFFYFTLLAIIISYVSLFAMSSFMTEQKVKEIGVRKVLGASVPGILLLLAKEFFKWVLLSNIISWPIAYIAANKWLQNFAYRTDIGIWTFLFSTLAALTIALLTVSYQSIKAAVVNPVEVLKYE